MKVNNKEEFDKQNIFGKGEANTAFADYFIGNSFLNPLTHPGECAVFLANVTFEPGCRKLAYPSCKKRRRADVNLHGGKWLVSRGRKGTCQSGAGNGYYDTAGSETLARSESRQLV